MTVATKVDPINRDVALIIDQELSPAAQARAFAEAAREWIGEAERVNLAALGVPPPFEVFVDGKLSGAIDAVRPGGQVVVEFDLLRPVVAWIDQQLRDHSPVRSGRYRKSHTLFADGIEANIRKLPHDARELVFSPTVPYARLIEPDKGSGRKAISKQAPDGVYHVVAALARRRFGRVVQISFGWRVVAGLAESKTERRARPNASRDMRQPSIVITI